MNAQFAASLRAVAAWHQTQVVPREIEYQNTTWKLAQAYAGLEELNSARKDVAHQNGLVWVVATPDGGAQSVRLQLPENWESDLKDAELLAKMEAVSATPKPEQTA